MASSWIDIALTVIKQEAGSALYTQYEKEFTDIVNDQAALRKLIQDAELARNSVKVDEYKAAYEATLLNLKNRIQIKDISLTQDKLESLVILLRTIFRILVHVLVG